MSDLTEKLRYTTCAEISCDQCDDEREQAAERIRSLEIDMVRIERDNKRLRAQVDLDERAKAMMLREYHKLREALQIVKDSGGYVCDVKQRIASVLDSLPNV